MAHNSLQDQFIHTNKFLIFKNHIVFTPLQKYHANNVNYCRNLRINAGGDVNINNTYRNTIIPIAYYYKHICNTFNSSAFIYNSICNNTGTITYLIILIRNIAEIIVNFSKSICNNLILFVLFNISKCCTAFEEPYFFVTGKIISNIGLCSSYQHQPINRRGTIV